MSPVEVEFESFSSLLNEAFVALQGDSKSWLQKIFGDKNDLSVDYLDSETNLNEVDISDVVYSSVSSELLDQLINKLPTSWLDSTQSVQLRQRIDNIKSKQTIATVLDDIVKTLQAVSNEPSAADPEPNSKESPTLNSSVSSQILIVNQFFLKLLETLNFPQDLQAPATALRDRVVGGVAEAEIPAILKAIADLVITIRSRIETEKYSLQEFLVQLTTRLNDIDSNLSGVINEDRKSTRLNSSHGYT